MRGCWWKCRTIESTKKYYGTTRFIYVGILVERLESNENLSKPLKIQINSMEKQGLLMRGCWCNCWKALATFKTAENIKKSNGKVMFINTGVLVELLESIEHL